MIRNAKPITSQEFNKGLVTRSDILKGDVNASPNTMDVQWNYDASLHKRFGANSTNATALTAAIATATAGWAIDTNSSLSTSIQAYWKLDEPSGNRSDQIGSLPLTDFTGVPSIVGLRNQAADFSAVIGSNLYVVGNSSLSVDSTNNESFSINFSVYFESTAGWPATQQIVFDKSSADRTSTEYRLSLQASGSVQKFRFITGSSNFEQPVVANSFGTINTGTWYNVTCWAASNSHVGISVNLSVDTASVPTAAVVTTNGLLVLGQSTTSNTGAVNHVYGRLDEFGFWKKVLSAQERADLYSNGSGNTYSGAVAGNLSFGWASFDFGASSIRWLTVAAGTGIMASSNRGTTFVNIATSRTASYQYLSRSKNVLIATSDQYDVPLYWAGSVGTFAATLAPGSAPGVKWSINYNGFLILLNSSARRRGFFYADENLQLTDPWTTAFDLPSSLDDEITNAFVLNKFLYISTRYKIFRMLFVGGNPDWNFLEVKQFGYVPRTVQICTLKGSENFVAGGQVAIGMDWDRRLRMFDGYTDTFISDSIENDNKLCDFAMTKISYAGSGLQICHAILDPITQEYRLNVAIGSKSTQTTHAIIFNCRNLAFYPYSNQQWQTMCIAESNNQRALMAVDRSGVCYILNSGNLDYGTTAINEVYESPPLFSAIPERVTKGKQLNLFFGVNSSNYIYYQDRIDLSNVWSTQVPLSNSVGNTLITGTENAIKILRTVNVPSIFNTYQFKLTSSSGTTSSAVPWELDRIDFLQQGFGIGIGN